MMLAGGGICVTIPGRVAVIGDSTFSGCSRLRIADFEADSPANFAFNVFG